MGGLARMPGITALRGAARRAGLEGPVHASARVLRDEGWLRSHRERRPVTRSGEPIPWYTYAAIGFLAERLPADATVFEFGAGNSTLWYAARCARVVSVDPNREWVDLLAPALPANATVVHHAHPAGKEGWLAEIGRHGVRWDLVAVDSAWREQSTKAALDHLTDRGVIVWDNSTLPDFARILRETLVPAGFLEMPFGGLVPIVPAFDRTSILYRAGNCLGI